MNFHGGTMTQQCLICAAESLTNYVDLTLVTSQTTQSETPVEDKLRSILTDKWREPDSDMAMVVCVPCFQMVDQFDTLESQLVNLRKELVEKYGGSFGRDKMPPPAKLEKQHRKRRGRPPKSANKSVPKIKIKDPVKPKRKYTKRKKVEKIMEVDSESDADTAWVPDDADNQDGDSSPGPSQHKEADGDLKKRKASENGMRARKESTKARAQVAALAAAAQSSSDADNAVDNPPDIPLQPPPPPEEEKNNNVYDEESSMLGLNPGEKLRMGAMNETDDGNITYACSYCEEIFVDIGMLKAHVRVRHRPEPLTTLLPVDMGFGNKVNCGMQLLGVTSTTELGKPFVCIFCDGAFKFKSNVLLHYKEKHTPYKPFSCVDCKEAFRRSMELSRHREREAKPKDKLPELNSNPDLPVISNKLFSVCDTIDHSTTEQSQL
uniref:C2H2-type domain-containing protein n=1 Tax=Timema monikensis TaxID=170555 RepID=A0A7R9ED92_9NEOP|nr:unnamed protein product [Timema monikensis]